MTDRRGHHEDAEKGAPACDADAFDNKLRRLRSNDLGGFAMECQQRYERRQTAVRETRYENAALGVGLIYAVRRSRIIRDRFNDAFDKQFGREPKADKLHREVFLFLYGEARKNMAGTDAIALSNAIAARISPRNISAYIKANRGLEELLHAERSRRDPWETIEIRVRAGVRRRLNNLEPGGRSAAVIMKSRRDLPAGARLAIIRLA